MYAKIGSIIRENEAFVQHNGVNNSVLIDIDSYKQWTEFLRENEAFVQHDGVTKLPLWISKESNLK